MDKNVTYLKQHANKLDSTATLAIVTKAIKGEALTVRSTTDKVSLTVLAHTSNVPVLAENDEVIVMRSQQGVIITAKLRAPDERPTQAFHVSPDGELVLEIEHSVTIKNKFASIQIDADGAISIDGKSVATIAQGEYVLRGGLIRIN